MVTSDRISAFDVVMDEPIPDKGRVLTAITAFWLEQLADIAQPPDLDAGCRHRRRSGEPDWPAGSCSCAGPRCCPSSASCGATCRARRGRSTSASGTVHGSAVPAGLQESDRLPEPLFTPSTKAEVGPTTRTSPSSRRSAMVGRAWPTRPPPSAWPSTSGPPPTPPSRGSSSPTPSSSWAGSTASWPLRRGAHARLVAVLGGRRLASGHDAAVVRQAAGARLAGGHRVGQDAAAPVAARRRGGRHRRPLRRGLRAPHGEVAG